MSCSFVKQVLEQMDILKNKREGKGYKNEAYFLPKESDKTVAGSDLLPSGAELTELTEEQADNIGADIEGLFESASYHHRVVRSRVQDFACDCTIACADVGRRAVAAVCLCRMPLRWRHGLVEARDA
mmetsp:Transcript_55549/g.144917  ORF Transcript_55549/g.144917 Transcript_55549/m.144917 type:complete len:127 (+) Transcript_55549:160-540(+)